MQTSVESSFQIHHEDGPHHGNGDDDDDQDGSAFNDGHIVYGQ